MTDKDHANAAAKELGVMLLALRKTTKGLKGALGSPGPNWSAALSARTRALEHLAEIGAAAPGPPPPPQTGALAPQTYNKGSGGQDARYCVAGLTKDSSGRYVDGSGFHYDDNGLSLGGRSGNDVPGLKPSDMMDDKGACDSYEWMGRVFPPWPVESYRV